MEPASSIGASSGNQRAVAGTNISMVGANILMAGANILGTNILMVGTNILDTNISMVGANISMAGTNISMAGANISTSCFLANDFSPCEKALLPGERGSTDQGDVFLRACRQKSKLVCSQVYLGFKNFIIR